MSMKNERFFTTSCPKILIAQQPLPRRDGSRLLVMDRERSDLEHRQVTDLPELLPPGTLVVYNDSRVIPARLQGRRESGGQV